MFVNTFEIKDPIAVYDKAAKIARVLGLDLSPVWQLAGRTFMTVQGDKDEIEALSDVLHVLHWVA